MYVSDLACPLATDGSRYVAGIVSSIDVIDNIDTLA